MKTSKLNTIILKYKYMYVERYLATIPSLAKSTGCDLGDSENC